MEKICLGCKKVLSISNFRKGSDICKCCEAREQNKDNTLKSVEDEINKDRNAIRQFDGEM